MDGGTTFEAVSASIHPEEAGLIRPYQGRNGRIPTFERRLSTKADFELGKSAWNASSRIWGTSKSFLDGAGDDEPTRPSPVRQGSLSHYAQGKPATSALRTATEVQSENAPQSKTPWGMVSNSIGFPSRQRTQPLSPTKQRQNQLLEFVANGPNGILDQPSLFAGSDPDVDDVPLDSQQTQYHRRALAAGSRALPSPTRTATFGSSQPDPKIQNLNSSRFRANDVFASPQEYDGEQDHFVDGFLQASINSGETPLLNIQGSGSFRPANGASLETLYRLHPRSPADERINDHLMNSEHLDHFRPLMDQDYDDAVRPFEAMNIGQIPAGPIPHRMPPSQLHPQRDTSFGPTRQSHLDSSFQATANGHSLGSRLNPQATPHYGGYQYAGRGSLAPLTNDYRSNLNSPYYSATGTPPTGPQSIRSTPGSGVSSRTSHHDPFVLERKLNGVEQYGYDPSMFGPGSIQNPMGNGFQYDMQMLGAGMRMNPLANPYVDHGHGGMHNYPSGPRMPIREPEQAHIVRSPLLEEFRLNSKSNRRFELKDIYGYMVEFSGDQHGSRFIQQKLETANSDEKEQIFKEIQPNLLQLMTDVFGNYVIQKMFEHGNQTQKKILAHQMKTHVLHLSMQMYGCRVVQKAFEHVLTDQQASLVKELDGPNFQILKVVKDQNGNHVVQKAIERIPGEHIQFIVDAHRGQMAKMSTHQYGCRVVQRMLEHCQPQAKRVILDELLEHIHPLISDSYGNYVVQHIIQNGEPRDRRQVVDIILSQLLGFSKHKFASNIVEKSLDCADDDQREQILRGLTGPNEQGVTPVLGLMRDQYGNYVLQKVFNQLQGARLLALRADMEHNYPILRRTSYGKQVIAIEKLLFGNSGPPPLPPTSLPSSRSSNFPSTNTSSASDSDAPHLHQADIK
ncbi:mRNA binding protein puf3 [Cladophialophora chaetospira]|uniref:Pumilio homology domain family member 3 n=1 Tax=Cladophialophora chaetospira TaxID=386627 RepID=A0AA38XFT2_9EURO|nr:mRNA binding protein puf3 [Cladophialophora chaetospira]